MSPVNGQKVLELNENMQPVQLDYTMQILEDPNGRLNAQDITSGKLDNEFVGLSSADGNLGYSTSYFWTKLTVRSNRPKNTKWLLECNFPRMNEFILYSKNEQNEWVKKQGGLNFPFNQREVKNRFCVFNVDVPDGEETTLYMRFYSENVTFISLLFWERYAFYEKVHDEQYWFGLYYGIILVMIVYNLILFFYLKDRTFIYYVLYILSFLFMQLASNGSQSAFFLQDSIWWAVNSMYYLVNATLLFAIIFTRLFLNTNLYAPKLDKVLQTLKWTCFILIPIQFFLSGQLASIIGNILTVLVITTSILASITCLIKGFKPAKYYLMAFAALFTGVFLILMMSVGILPANFVTINGMQIGSALEAILLSFALGNRLADMRRDKEDAQANLIVQLTENEKIKDEANRLLEQKVEERTAELADKNTHLTEAKSLIEEHNKHITDSIDYALRIQQALLPEKEEIYNAFPNSFIFYKPKDIVSGDFYWFHRVNSRHFLIAAADCTGHGVPGALMSMIGNTLLNEIVTEKGVHKPGIILDLLNKMVKQTLKQKGNVDDTRDGMDIILCSIEQHKGIKDKQDKFRLEYAGANRPLHLYQSGELNLVKPDKMAIAGFTEDDYRFTTHTFELRSNDTCYLYSDGFADQMGGPRGKKFMTKQMRELLTEFQDTDLQQQVSVLEDRFYGWQGEHEQIDDVLVIGLRF